MTEMRVPMVRDVVIYHDPKGQPHNALITNVWSNTCINLAFVSSDPARSDSYGRQIERTTSMVHGSQQAAHGNYWRWPDEEPNQYIEPQQT